MAGRLLCRLSRANTWLGGRFRITGTVTELGTAGAYRVRLYDRKTGTLLQETWSSASGAYTFPFIAAQDNGYYAIAFDHASPYHNAAIADLITPEPMP